MKQNMLFILIVTLFSCVNNNSKNPSTDIAVLEQGMEVVDSSEHSNISEDEVVLESVESDEKVGDSKEEAEEKSVIHQEENIITEVEEGNPLKKTEEVHSTMENDLEKIGGDKKEIEEKEESKSEVETKDPSQDQVAPPIAVVEVSHDSWDLLLKKYVSQSGEVNYSGLKSEESTIDNYLNDLSQYMPTDEMSRNAKMAYWINAYNAFTVKLILKNWPVKSILNLNGGKAWDVKWIELGGQKYSLNQIEHEILRKKYPDARIHFAVNCAAQSCPPLWNRAWTDENLNSSLEKRTRLFIQDEKYNQITSSKLRLSKIFDWYQVDFGNVVEYVNKYVDQDIPANSKVKYIDYDWALNGK